MRTARGVLVSLLTSALVMTGLAPVSAGVGVAGSVEPPPLTSQVAPTRGAQGPVSPSSVRSDPVVTTAAAPRSGQLAMWGVNGSGELGDGTTQDRLVPVEVLGMTGVTSAAKGYYSTYAARSDGTVWAWGYNAQGQLGTGNTTNSKVPLRVRGLTGAVDVAGGSGAGYALTADGQAWSWGHNYYGELGLGHFYRSTLPQPITALTDVVEIEAGYGTALALLADGTVWAWGWNSSGQLGVAYETLDESNVPIQVAGLTDVTAIATSGGTSYALRSDGTVWAWGENSMGQGGHGTWEDGTVLTPTQVTGLTDVRAIAAAAETAYALRSDGTVWAWGYSEVGALGNGSVSVESASALVPSQVVGVSSATAVGASAGRRNAQVLLADGSVWAWGEGEYDALGNGSLENSGTPIQVSGVGEVSSISGSGGLAIIKGWPAPRALSLGQTFGCECFAGRSTGNQVLEADPVNTATGGLVERVSDLSVVSLGTPMEWSRTYNSLDTSSGPLGPGWSFAYGASLTQNPAGELVLRDGSGTQTRFAAVDGGYTPVDPAVTATLSAGADGTRVARALTGTTMTFDDTGRLMRLADERGRGLTLGYAGAALSSITDDLGQTLGVTWDAGSGPEARIASVASSDGRSVSYTYTTSAGARRLTGATDVSGNTTTFAYTSAGLLSQITDPLGNVSARSEYDADGRVISQLDEMGATTTFAYIALGPTTATTVTDPSGRTRQYVYNGYNLIKQVDGEGNAGEILYSANNAPAMTVDQLGHVFASEYDARGNLVRRTAPAPLSYVETWTYDEADHVTTYTDPGGSSTAYTYGGGGLLETVTTADGAVTRYVYTTADGGAPADLLASVTDPLGRTTTYSYDARGDLTATTSPLGGVTSSTYDAAHRVLTSTTPEGEVTSYTYDTAGRLLTTTDPLGGVTTNVYDAAGRRTKTTDAVGRSETYAYDKADRLLQTTYSSGKVVKQSYDEAGRVATSTDARGRVTRLAYDDNGRLYSTRDPLGRFTTHIYDELGQLIEVSDPLGEATEYAYDALGRRVSVTDPDGVTLTTTYDQLGNITATTDETGAAQTATYDAMGRVVKSLDSDGASTRYVYDLAGQLVSTAVDRSGTTPIPGYTEDRTTYAYDADGNRVSTTDARGNVPGALPADYTSTIAYDANGRPLVTTDPLGHATTTTYDALGRARTVTDPAGKATTTAYDPIGRVTQVTDPNGAVTKYAYNANSDLTQVTDPRGRLTKYTYDAAGNRLTSTDPLGRVTAATYDAAGALATTTKPSGTATTTAGDSMLTFQYDGVGRLAGVDFSGATPDLTYTYTPAGRPDVLTRAADALGVTAIEYSYDDAGRTSAIRRTGPRPTSATYHYTAGGRLAGAAWSTGGSVDFAYDTVGQLTTVTPSDALPVPAITFGYDPAGNTATVTRAGATPTISTYTYDQAAQLSTLDHRAGSALIAGYQLTRDPRGYPTRVTSELLDPVTGSPVTSTSLYGYDANGWLTSECTPTTGATCTSTSAKTTYAYDSAGVRTASAVTRLSGAAAHTTTTTYGYDAADQLLTLRVGATTSTTNTWTRDGAIATTTTSAGTRTYTSNLADEITSIKLEDNRTIGYSYDPAGNRTARTTNGAVDTTWAWEDLSGLPVRIGEYGATGALTTSWLPDPTSDTGAVLTADAGGESSWLLADPFANVVATIPVTGATTGVRTQAVDAFGSPTSTATPVVPLGFAGQFKDGATGLYDMRARDYNPATGQFLSIDPLVDRTRQPYAYGNNNPLVFSDPTGLIACGPSGGDCNGSNLIPVFNRLSRSLDDSGYLSLYRSLTPEQIGEIGYDDMSYIHAEAATRQEHMQVCADNPGQCLPPCPEEGYQACQFARAGTILAGFAGGQLLGVGFSGLLGRACAADAAAAANTAVRAGPALAPSVSLGNLLMPGGSAIGKAGTSASIREITGGLSEAQTVFSQLSQGGRVVAQTPSLTRVQLPDGGFVQLRTVMSRSPHTAATIDVNISGIEITKLKFNP